MKTQSKPELRSKIEAQESIIKNYRFTLDKATEDRNRYARLYDAEVAKVQNLEKSAESNEQLVVKLSIGVAIIAGMAIFFGTIVACVGFNL